MRSPYFDDTQLPSVTEVFSQSNKCRLANFFELEDANSLSQAVQNIREYDLVFHAGGENKAVPEAELRKHSDETRQQLQAEIFENAAKGIGFLYGRRLVQKDDENQKLRQVFEWLNSPATISWIKSVTGMHDITHADANVTRFARSEFLTRHNDVLPGETRRVAFVINLSPKWHADWGGLLQFFEADGTSTHSWTPTFNSLSLFDVKHIHSVTSIAPYAPALRLAISGWFRA
jgi:Rps23 Pro-64 3,4-dihydroxylase Tpa1-like proline 4-hydroxylase